MKMDPARSFSAGLPPSLRGLSFALRLPIGFTWNYDSSDCARRLAGDLWGVSIADLGVSSSDEDDIFYGRVWRRRGIRLSDVTPFMIADEIDAYLASHA